MVFAYYYTCWMSGVIELGTILWGIANGYSLIETLGLAVAYQFGNLALFLISKKLAKYEGYIFLLIGIILCIIGFISDIRIKYIIMCLVLSVFSTFLQIVRQAVKGNIPRWKKRTCRVIGFFSSVLFFLPYGIWIFSAFSFSLFIISFFIPKFGYNHWFLKLKNGELGVPRICWAMVTHQAHYFAYNYVFLVIVYLYYNNPYIATLWFVCNWIPYTITEPLVKIIKLRNYYIISIVAHIFNATVLALMYFFTNNNDILGAALLWVLTGFGGGNVFCIREALKKHVDYHDNIWMFSEQIGHLLGLISSIAFVVVLGQESTLLLGAGFALLTIPVIILTLNKKRDK